MTRSIDSTTRAALREITVTGVQVACERRTCQGVVTFTPASTASSR